MGRSGGWLDVILLFLLLRSAGSKVASQADCAGQRVSIPHADLSVYLVTTSTNPLTSDLANIRKQPASA